MVPETEFTTTMAESMATRAWQPEHGNQQAGMALEERLSAHISIHKQEAEKAN